MARGGDHSKHPCIFARADWLRADGLCRPLVRKFKLPGPDCLPAILLWPLLALVPAGILFSLNATPWHVVAPRYFLVAAPGSALTWGMLTSRIDSRFLRQTFCVGLVAITVFQCFRPSFVRQRELNFERDMPVKMRDG